MAETQIKKRIAIVSDAYFPQVSGVAVTIRATKKELEKRGHEVLVVSPRDARFTIPMPGYSEIKLVFFGYGLVRRKLDTFKPDIIHISVEGPLGYAARRYCLNRKFHFTTAYHTRFPEYVKVRIGVPLSWSYAVLRWFHGKSSNVMVASHALVDELRTWGIHHAVYWPRGVDTSVFNPSNPQQLTDTRPIFMYMGRVAKEKNLRAFLDLDLPGTKYIVGDGPARRTLEAIYADVVFTGYKFGEELASYVAAADVFVFPSLTDTLGLVMLEANACGVPVAALPSQASETVIVQGVNGIIDGDLQKACIEVLKLDRTKVRKFALTKGWEEPTDLFLENLVPAKLHGV